MNYIKAVKEAQTGKRIRRKSWEKGLSVQITKSGKFFDKGLIFGLFSRKVNIVPESITAEDWEVEEER